VNYELIIVRYGEIALKGKETRKYFENCLITNIKNVSNLKNIPVIIKKERGRIYIYTDQIKKSIDLLKRIFGIISISPAVLTDSNIDSISDLAVKIVKRKINKKTSFAIRATRTGNHDYTSQDVAIKVGNAIVKETKAPVNLSNPDFELGIEIREQNAYIFIEKIRGTGGMPHGSQGNVLSIIDSVESILASWYLMRRGCKSIFLKTKKLDNEIINSFMDKWFIKSDILEINTNNNLYEQIKKIAEKKDCKAIVTNHSIYINQDKTIKDLKKIKKNLGFPILTPLIAMNKEEINNKCKEIGIKI
jgi:thiamine biosynthesis protein ThiI